jgi:hypothetical protein
LNSGDQSRAQRGMPVAVAAASEAACGPPGSTQRSRASVEVLPWSRGDSRPADTACPAFRNPATPLSQHRAYKRGRTSGRGPPCPRRRGRAQMNPPKVMCWVRGCGSCPGWRSTNRRGGWRINSIILPTAPGHRTLTRCSFGRCWHPRPAQQHHRLSSSG